jgi:hypothetical protein
VKRVLERLDGVRATRSGWRGRCKAHSDRRPSLDVREGADGRALIVCRAGCRTSDVLSALGLRWSDLFVAGDARTPRYQPRALDEYDLARRDALAEVRRQLARIDSELYADSDSIRACDHVVGEARAIATALGPSDDVWELLRKVAELETLTRAAETRLNDA